MLTTLAVIAALAYSPGGIPPIVGATEPRDALLATPAPWPSARPVSSARPEIGRPWAGRAPVASRTPLSEITRGDPGAASYGAPARTIGEPIYARVNHAIIAIDPWSTIEGRGALETLELARNEWLREQGYILRARSHANPLAAYRSLPTPRATIELLDEPGPRRSRIRVSAEPAGGPITRVSLPPQFVAAGPAHVVEPASALAQREPHAE